MAKEKNYEHSDRKAFGTISQKKIAILGFSFKGNTNDTRESPAIDICKELLEEDCNLSIYDPKVNVNQISIDLEKTYTEPNKINNQVGKWSFSESVLDASKNADAIIILTEWEEFKKINWQQIAANMRSPSWIFDTRSIADLNEAKLQGLNIWRVGNG